jgi:hypothetical protein
VERERLEGWIIFEQIFSSPANLEEKHEQVDVLAA